MSEVSIRDVETAVGAWLARLRETTGVAALADVGWSLDVWAPAPLEGVGEEHPLRRARPRPDHFEVDVHFRPLGGAPLEPDELGRALGEALSDQDPPRSLGGLRVRRLHEVEQEPEHVVVRIGLDGRAGAD